VALPERCRVEHEMIQKQTVLVQQLLLSAAALDATDPAICMCAVSYSCRIQKNEGMIGTVCNTLEVRAVLLRGVGWYLVTDILGQHVSSIFSSQTLWNACPLKMGLICCPKMCVMNYHPMIFNISEE
jgi:hypothetical protein